MTFLRWLWRIPRTAMRFGTGFEFLYGWHPRPQLRCDWTLGPSLCWGAFTVTIWKRHFGISWDARWPA